MRKAVKFGGAFVLVLGLILSGVAGSQPAPQKPFTIGVGDKVAINVWGEPEMSVTAIVQPDGTIWHPLAGKVRAAGRTPDQLAAEFQKLLEKWLKRPLVTVEVVEVARREAYILGDVNSPGAYAIARPVTLLQAISLAGGLSGGARRAEVTVLKADGSLKRATLEISPEALSGPSLWIERGDTVLVRAERPEAAVIGAVSSPGTYPVGPEDTLLDLLTKAGGPTKAADLSTVLVVRKGRTVKLDLKPLFEGTSVLLPPKVEPGDLVIVPRVRKGAALVTGEVASPGLVVVKPGMTLAEALAGAGGLTKDADLSSVEVVREGGSRTLDLTKTAEASEFEIKPGDIVVVHRKRASKVILLGGVGSPGVYDLAEGETLLDLLARAGGVTETPVPEEARLLRGGKVLPVGLKALLSGDLSKNVELELGDVVIVPLKEAYGKAIVLGGVGSPGSHPISEGETLLDLIAKAGGISGPIPKEGRILRKGKVMKVDLQALLRGGDLSQNVPILPDDVVLIPSRAVVGKAVALGGVANPGPVEISEGETLLDLIAKAGGVKGEPPEEARILRGGEVLKVKLKALLKEGDLSQNVSIQPGDVLVVPPVEERAVTVLGAVRLPGRYALAAEKRTVLDLVSAAGGYVEGADLRRCRLIRQGRAVPLDLEKALYEGDLTQNPAVEPGDVIIVPGPELRVFVAGQVRMPGLYKLSRGSTLTKALQAAGWAAPEAKLSEVGLVRVGKVTKVNVERMLGTGDFSKDPPLQDGDIVYVPKKGKKIEWRDVVSVLYGLDLLFRITGRIK